MSNDNEKDPVVAKVEDGLAKTEDYIDNQLKEIDDAIEKTENQLQEQLDNIGETHDETHEKLENLQKSYNTLKERQDAMESKAGRVGSGGQSETFEGLLKDALADNYEGLTAMKNEEIGRLNIELDTKMDTKATMTSSSDLTNQVIEPTRVDGVIHAPDRATHVREFLPQGTTDSDVIWYITEENFTDSTDTVSENSNKPESDTDLKQNSASVTKIAALFRVSTEMLNDVEFLSSHLSTRGRKKYRVDEDDQLLYGSGSGADLSGLTTTATAYSSGISGDSNANEYDIIIDTLSQLAANNYRASAGMISPSRYYDMIRSKDADGNYVIPEAVAFSNQPLMVDGVPIIPTTALNTNDFLIADFPMMTTLFDRQGLSVRFFEQDRDNVQKNLVTVQIEGRLALPTFLGSAARYGDFSNAISAAGNS